MAMAPMAVGSSAISLDIPQTQNTAPVLEYRCMFTSDIRRKQKRWQDGRLKFHTFNKRVMVYDERSNFVGDTHWKKGYEFDAGEELELDRGGILVEVDEYLRKEDQDLHELLTKRLKEKEERASARTAASPSRPASVRSQNIATSAVRIQHQEYGPATRNTINALRPKPLNAVIGNPTGHYGRALAPNTSPFEQRLANRPDERSEVRPAKRQRRVESPPNKSGYAQNLMGATLTLSSQPASSARGIRYEPLRISRSVQQSLANTIDLTLDEEKVLNDQRSRNLTRGDMEQPKNGTKVSARKSYRSLPLPSGYASKLTGAALSLGGPSRDMSFSRIGGTPGFSGNRDGRASRQDQMSALPKQAVSKANTRPPKQISEASTERQAAPEYSDNIPKSTQAANTRSSSPLASVRTIRDRSSNRLSAPILDSPADGASIDQPVSSLRIKARPPRKMMMLMQRSSSGLLDRIGKTDQGRPTDLNNTGASGNASALSQSSKRLNDFCEKQAKLLAERLRNGNPSIVEDEDLVSSPSPDDSGIDAETPNLLFTRKAGLDKTQEQLLPSPGLFARCKQRVAADLAFTNNVGKNLTTTNQNPCNNSALSTLGKAPECQDPTADVPTRLCPGAQGSDNSGGEEADQRIGNRKGMATDVLSNVSVTASGMTFSATDRFRAILTSPGSAQDQSHEANTAIRKDILDVNIPSTITPKPGHNPTSTNVTVHPSLQSPPPPQQLSRNCRNITKAQTPSINPLARLTHDLAASKLPPAPIQRPKIANPATRGPALLSIANQTANTLTEVSNAMPPPAAPVRIANKLLNGPEGSQRQQEEAGAVGSAPVGGPWSREAFDLFGDWKPPRRREGVGA